MYRNTFFVVLLLILVTVPWCARAELYMSVSGKVVAADDGSGLGGIRILLMSHQKGKVAETKSNAQGVFTIKDVPKGQYDLLAMSDDPFIISSTAPNSVTVLDGKNVVGIIEKLQKGGAIKGKIITGTGIPMPQVDIMGSGGASAKTDKDGNFLLKGLKPGNIDLAVVPTAIGVKILSLPCEAGKITDAGNIVFSVGAATSISGTVIDSNGTPVSNAILVASREVGAGGGYSLVNANGAFFIIGLESTIQYKLTVIAYGYETQTIHNVTIPSNALSIKLTPDTTITATGFRSGLTNSTHKNKVSNGLPVRQAEALGDSGYCPGGEWIGASVDITALFSIPFLTLTDGGSLSVGIFDCYDYTPRLDFRAECKYLGSSYAASINAGVGVSFMYVPNACYEKDLLGPSDGFVLSIGKSEEKKLYGIYGGVGVDFAEGNVTIFSLSFGFSLDFGTNWKGFLAKIEGLPDLDKLAAYRHCSTDPIVNAFEWWCDNYGLCL